ncbi:hypothetical protein [Nitrosomonas aestuarii]|uniref:hypothetical protein n=1 Tax=Nitrosomonas aestuarii TaxID=52441 RepID=UPI00147AC215|nr:hypothetical protein [Nitrosomonas aestuarii]
MNDKKVPVKEKLAASFKVLQLGQVSPSRIGSADPLKVAIHERIKRLLVSPVRA